jgi:hypothetical protein
MKYLISIVFVFMFSASLAQNTYRNITLELDTSRCSNGKIIVFRVKNNSSESIYFSWNNFFKKIAKKGYKYDYSNAWSSQVLAEDLDSTINDCHKKNDPFINLLTKDSILLIAQFRDSILPKFKKNKIELKKFYEDSINGEFSSLIFLKSQESFIQYFL